jgi:hypothetical protein
MNWKTRTVVNTALLALALTATVARADWNVGEGYKMHFPQRPDTSGYDVNFRSPMIVADDWRCSETGPVKDIHFWFSARNDWLNLELPLDTQIFNIHVSIHADIPAGVGGVPFSRPGNLLWERDYNVGQVKIRQAGQGWQWWYDPANGALIPNDHRKIYQCNIAGITEPFYQKKGTIYWLDISISSLNELGWKSSNQAMYPPPWTNVHFQDDATWRPAPTANWQDIRYPSGPKLGQSMDMAFVITGYRQAFNHKMHFPQYPDPTGADVHFTFPRVAADDWRCTESGPVEDIHFWFSAFNDWLDITQPLNQQIFNIHLSIHADIPVGPGNPYSRPGALLWARDYNVMDPAVRISRCYTEGQGWLDPQQGGYLPNNHIMMYQCDIRPIFDPFIQQVGTIYWLDVSIASEGPLGWKTSDVDVYPSPWTGNHFQDDAVWAPDITVPAIPWMELVWPANAPKAGQSIDLSFVITDGLPTDVGDGAPQSYHLEQNHPNPFNPNTTIRYRLPESSRVELAIFGVDGRLIRVLESSIKPSGVFEATWDGRDSSGQSVASGVYFYRLKANAFSETKKMVLLK